MYSRTENLSCKVPGELLCLSSDKAVQNKHTQKCAFSFLQSHMQYVWALFHTTLLLTIKPSFSILSFAPSRRSLPCLCLPGLSSVLRPLCAVSFWGVPPLKSPPPSSFLLLELFSLLIGHSSPFVFCLFSKLFHYLSVSLSIMSSRLQAHLSLSWLSWNFILCNPSLAYITSDFPLTFSSQWQEVLYFLSSPCLHLAYSLLILSRTEDFLLSSQFWDNYATPVCCTLMSF